MARQWGLNCKSRLDELEPVRKGTLKPKAYTYTAKRYVHVHVDAASTCTCTRVYIIAKVSISQIIVRNRNRNRDRYRNRSLPWLEPGPPWKTLPTSLPSRVSGTRFPHLRIPSRVHPYRSRSCPTVTSPSPLALLASWRLNSPASTTHEADRIRSSGQFIRQWPTPQDEPPRRQGSKLISATDLVFEKRISPKSSPKIIVQGHGSSHPMAGSKTPPRPLRRLSPNGASGWKRDAFFGRPLAIHQHPNGIGLVQTPSIDMPTGDKGRTGRIRTDVFRPLPAPMQGESTASRNLPHAEVAASGSSLKLPCPSKMPALGRSTSLYRTPAVTDWSS